MDSNSYHPTFHVQPGLVVNEVQTSQPIPPTSHILIFQHMSQPVQAQVHVSQPLQIASLTQPLPLVSWASQVPLTQPIQGTLQPPLLGQAIPQIQMGQPVYGMT